MSDGAVHHTRIFDTPKALAEHVADWIIECAREAPRRFAICLSGGSTPKRLYELLGQSPRRERFPWDRSHWFWGDERVVPHDDPQSNFHMVSEALLRHVPIPPGNIHAIPTDGFSADAGAAAYEAVLKRFYGAEALDPVRPLFDLTLLGLGEDGHIASLFPGSAALRERERWVVPVVGENPLDRITLTCRSLASSELTAFLVAGERKRDVLARVRAGDAALPATRLRPDGTVYWFADRAAAPAPVFSGE